MGKIIAGPCSAESYEQLEKTLLGILEQDIILDYFRAGVWKPRTRPGNFEGYGEKALGWLNDLKKKYSIKIITEVALPEHVRLIEKYNIDAIWIGARTTANPFMIDLLAEHLDGMNIPVFIKNPIHFDLDLWFGAVDRFKNRGIKDISLILRGFKLYENNYLRNDPMWHNIEIIKKQGIDIYLDPSHITGKKTLIPEVCQSANCFGINNFMIETHCDPENALSDADQQIKPDELKKILSNLDKFSCENNLILVDKKIKEISHILKFLENNSRSLKFMNLHELDKLYQNINRVEKFSEDNNIDKRFLSDLFNLLKTYNIKK